MIAYATAWAQDQAPAKPEKTPFQLAVEAAREMPDADAQEAALIAIAGDPQWEELHRIKAVKAAAAIDVARKGLKPGDSAYYFAVAEYLAENCPDLPLRPYFVAQMYRTAGDRPRALAEYTKAATRTGGGWRAHSLRWIGDFLHADGDASGARDAYAAAILEGASESCTFYMHLWRGIERTSGDLTPTAYYNLARNILAHVPPPEKSVEEFAPLIARIEYRLETLE